MVRDEQIGEVAAWNAEEGYGEIALVQDDRRVWAHYAVIESSGPPGGFRSLVEGSRVMVSIEKADQDGYSWRATSVRQVQDEERR